MKVMRPWFIDALIENLDRRLKVVNFIHSGVLHKAMANEKISKSQPLCEKNCTIKRFARDSFKAIHCVATFPLRYLGSKTWSIPGIILRTPILLFRRIIFKEPITKEKLFGSGYHFQNGKRLSEVEAKEYLRYVSIGLVPFRYEHEKWALPFGAKIVSPLDLNLDLKKIPGKLEADGTKKAFIDNERFFKALVFEDDNELVVTFGPLHSHWNDYDDSKILKEKLDGQYLGVASNYAGGVPRSFQQADALIEQLKVIAEKKKKKLVVTGQSLAGAFASYAALKHEVKGICFNSVHLGAGLQYEIGSEKLAKADQYLTHITIEGDIVSQAPGIGILNQAFSIIGMRTPGNFGNRFTIPSAYKTMRDSHDYPIKSFMAYLGYDKEAKADELDEEDIIRSK